MGAEPVGVPRGPLLLLGDGLWAGRFGVLPTDRACGGWDFGHCETGEAARYVCYCVESGAVIYGRELTSRLRGAGTAREYEMVQSVSRVVTLPDDESWEEVDLVETSEWERIQAVETSEAQVQKSYAAVLRA